MGGTYSGKARSFAHKLTHFAVVLILTICVLLLSQSHGGNFDGCHRLSSYLGWVSVSSYHTKCSLMAYIGVAQRIC